ncbi:MAG: hypothetical protein Q4B14_06205 [Clostridia bacterium]|nr:hypothetical protein [Clostridia bacterium]
MNNFLEKIARFMYGRYGVDSLTFALIIFYFVLSLILRMTIRGPIYFISYIPLVYAFYRVLSKNISARQKENQFFLKYWNKIRYGFKAANKNFKDHQEHKYFKCPNCSQKLRAPRGRGKIRVTCQRCGRTFDKKV